VGEAAAEAVEVGEASARQRLSVQAASDQFHLYKSRGGHSLMPTAVLWSFWGC